MGDQTACNFFMENKQKSSPLNELLTCKINSFLKHKRESNLFHFYHIKETNKIIQFLYCGPNQHLDTQLQR